MEKVKNRWLIAASAVGIHLSIGSVYAWSIYTKPLIDRFGWGLKETQFTFSLAIFFLGLSAAFLAKHIEKLGPRKSGLIAAILFGVGTVGSGFAIKIGSLYLLYLCYGVIGGIGLGIGYLTPVSALLKWFPDKKGLASGLAIMGFGFAALVSGPLVVYLIRQVGIESTFFVMGASYFLIILVASSYIDVPPQSWLSKYGKQAEKTMLQTDSLQLSADDAVKTKRFWFLWLMFFVNIACGITVISVASPMAQEFTSLGPAAAAAMVGIMGIFNGGGRIGWAAFSDFLGRGKTFVLVFAVQIIAYFLLPQVHNAILFQGLVFILISCYGAGFSTIPAYISDLFGAKDLSRILGYMLTAWAAAGMAGPLVAAGIRSAAQGYEPILYGFALLLCGGLILSVLLIRQSRTMAKPSIEAKVEVEEYDDYYLPEFVD